MEYDSSNKSPYHGMWASCSVMIIFPVGLYFLFTYYINEFQDFPKAMNDATAQALGFGLGTLFHLSCAVCGAFRDSFRVVTKRLAEFFDNLTISVKFAFKGYWWNIKENGVAFWIYFVIMLVCFCICVDGLRDFLALWQG